MVFGSTKLIAMEYYTLSRYAYWKYYFLILYYRLAEYPASVRGWIVFGTVCMLLLVLIVIGNFVRYISAYRFDRLIARNRARYYNRMRSVVSQTRTLEPGEISAIMELPKNFKMKEGPAEGFGQRFEPAELAATAAGAQDAGLL